MSVHFVAAIVGALVAAGGCGVLAARSLRIPSAAVIAWAVALAGLTVSLGAQVLGYSMGFWGTAFRVMAVGSLVVAPLALALGLTEIAARGMATRFAGRLILSALGFVAIIILATDPLGSATFTRAWPSPATYYQPIPNALLQDLLAPITVIITLIAVVTVAVRQGREPAWRDAFGPTVAAGLAALVLSAPGLAGLAGISLPLASGFVLLCILAAVLIWAGGVLAGGLDTGVLRGTAPAGARRDGARRDGPPAGARRDGRPAGARRDGPPAGARRDARDRVPDPDDEFGIFRPSGSRRGARPAGYAADDDPEYSAGYSGERRPGARRLADADGYPDGGFPGPGGELAADGYAGDSQYAGDGGEYDGDGFDGGGEFDGDGRFDGDGGYPQEAVPAARGGYPAAGGGFDGPGGAGYPEQVPYAGRPDYADRPPFTGEMDAAPPGYAGPAAAYHDESQALANGDPQMFGQIAIYTLLEDRAAEFDQLTRKVVRQVREQEPGTLVYIVHAVPAAPMQRILYEVYADRAAYEAHKQQPYVVSFEAGRRPYVLATNVIELGLQQAKVSPLPSVTDLLSDTGFDLLSDTGFGQPGYGPRRAPRHGGDLPGGSAARSL